MEKFTRGRVAPIISAWVSCDIWGSTAWGAETNMEFNRGDYVKLTESAAQEVGVVWEIHPTEIASLEVYWWDGGNRWSKYYEPKNLTLVQPTELPDYAIELRGSLGL
jgi:hypothetical protein